MTVYIHALREEGDLGFCKQVGQVADISIHALREERDTKEFFLFSHNVGISIHALREEGDGLLMCSNLFSW